MAFRYLCIGMSLRKPLSFLFIVLMFLNIMGYYWILVGLHYNSAVSLEKRLSEERYSDAETITFKFHLTLPYYFGEEGFERAEGQFEFGGEYYHLVKQQYANDTLQLVCIKNHGTQRINRVLNDYVKTFADQPGNRGKTITELSSFIKDYLAQEFSILHSSQGWSTTLQFWQTLRKSTISYQALITQPPEQS